MHVAAQNLNIGLMFAAIFSMAAMMQTTAQAGAQPTPVMWAVSMDEAWGYGANWYWNPSTSRISGTLSPNIVVESVEDGVIKGRITTSSGHTLPLYGEDSRVLVTYGYDTGVSSPQFSVIPEKGEFSIEMPDSYRDADYVILWVNGHSFHVTPSGAYPESETSVVTNGPTSETSTSTFITDDGLEGTIETVVSEESTTTTEITSDEELVVKITTTKGVVTETNTTTTPKPTSQMSTAAEKTNESSTISNSSSTTSTNTDGRITTVTDIVSAVSSKTEETTDDESITKITTVSTNSTKIVTETISLAYDTGLITIWDNHRHFKIDGYFLFDGEYDEDTYYEGWITVVVNSAKIEYRLGS